MHIIKMPNIIILHQDVSSKKNDSRLSYIHVTYAPNTIVALLIRICWILILIRGKCDIQGKIGNKILQERQKKEITKFSYDQ